MILSVIAAVAENGVIGKDGRLPWKLPDDLRRFKKLTMGHALVMGRKTFQSIGRLLPGRLSVVITRDPGFRAEGARVVGSFAEALAACAGEEEVFVIGGGEIFREAMPVADRFHLTLVHAAVEGDTRFPDWVPGDWLLLEETPRPADTTHAHAMTFRIYERRRG